MADIYVVQVIRSFTVVQNIGQYGTLEKAQEAANHAASFVQLGANEAVVISTNGKMLPPVKSGEAWPR
jgi:hypothetical protein